MKRSGFIGIGTGRCGTVSLGSILNHCQNVEATHERFLSPWYARNPEVDKLLGMIETEGEEGIVYGDVQSHILPHVPYMQSRMPRLRVVCLHRPKNEVVESFLKWWQGKSNIRPQDRDSISRKEWFDRFPDIDAATPRQAIEFYWEMYEQKARALGQSVFHMNMEDLNDDSKLHELCDYLGIPERDRRFPETRQYNSWEGVIEHVARTRAIRACGAGQGA